MFKVIKHEGRARRGQFSCAHGGMVQTPVFMNVGTQGAIKGAVSAHDLKDLKCQIELSNTYHLHLRPGDDVVRALGGLHKMMDWDGPILTDSGGFQVFSLAGLRKITEEGVAFASHIDGRRIFMGPEESMRIQSHLGSFAITTVGKINNFDELLEEIYKDGPAHFQEMTNGQINATELIAALICKRDSLVEGIRYVQETIDGSMTLLLLTKDGIYGARDRYGRTPLIIGQKEDAYCISFENFAYINLGYEDYKELLKDAEIDVVHVCTPNVAHCPITVAAFEAGKHVLCEKPMAATTEDAQKMMDAWKNHDGASRISLRR